ncbi:MAG: fructose-6-phosphate aldolase [Alphaproteobacteria bacterium]|nr:fructose-6-phosphate aldolase [Alphaproteobacteria bacterium]
MEIFLDTADISAIEKYKDFVDGVTTNPSILSRQKKKDVHDIVLKISRLVAGPVSVEVISGDFGGMVREGESLAKIHPNVCVKLPCTFDGLRACKTLSNKGIATNLTLCFSVPQAMMAAKCGATYVSPFIGRIDDIGQDGINLISDIVEVYGVYGFETKVLSASVRNINHFIQAAMAGTDAITVPEKVLEQVFTHPLTDIGLKKFMDDWNKSKGK